MASLGSKTLEKDLLGIDNLTEGRGRYNMTKSAVEILAL
jgi:hypothetical protein